MCHDRGCPLDRATSSCRLESTKFCERAFFSGVALQQFECVLGVTIFWPSYYCQAPKKEATTEEVVHVTTGELIALVYELCQWLSLLNVKVQMFAGPNAREGENVFGVAHIYASFNDTFVVRIIRAV